MNKPGLDDLKFIDDDEDDAEETGYVRHGLGDERDHYVAGWLLSREYWRERERKQIVAWLRSIAGFGGEAERNIANAIERGDHWKGGGE